MDVFLLEANAIARAHVKAMEGNALLTYQLNKCVLIDHPYKNQVRVLLPAHGCRNFPYIHVYIYICMFKGMFMYIRTWYVIPCYLCACLELCEVDQFSAIRASCALVFFPCDKHTYVHMYILQLCTCIIYL